MKVYKTSSVVASCRPLCPSDPVLTTRKALIVFCGKMRGASLSRNVSHSFQRLKLDGHIHTTGYRHAFLHAFSTVIREIFIAAKNVSEKVVKKYRTCFMSDTIKGKVHPKAGLEGTERE